MGLWSTNRKNLIEHSHLAATNNVVYANEYSAYAEILASAPYNVAVVPEFFGYGYGKADLAIGPAGSESTVLSGAILSGDCAATWPFPVGFRVPKGQRLSVRTMSGAVGQNPHQFTVFPESLCPYIVTDKVETIGVDSSGSYIYGTSMSAGVWGRLSDGSHSGCKFIVIAFQCGNKSYDRASQYTFSIGTGASYSTNKLISTQPLEDQFFGPFGIDIPAGEAVWMQGATTTSSPLPLYAAYLIR